MTCPFCGALQVSGNHLTKHPMTVRVIDKRDRKDGRIRRRRECLACGQRYSTLEVVQQPSAWEGLSVVFAGGAEGQA